MFGTLDLEGTHVQDTSVAAPPVVDLSPIVPNLSIDLTVALNNKVKSLKVWIHGGGPAAARILQVVPPVVPPVVPLVVPLVVPPVVPPVVALPAPVSAACNSTLDAELSSILLRLDFLELKNTDQ